MDMSDPSTTASPNGDEISKIISSSKRDNFFRSYCNRQKWAFKDPIISYITMNPSSPQVYEKLIKSCKYFWVNNPILVVKEFNLSFYGNVWETLFNGKKFDFNNLSCKLWINDKISIDGMGEKEFFSLIVRPKIYQSDIKKFRFFSSNISYNDFIFLASKCEGLWLDKATVINDDGSVVPLEELFEVIPKVKCFDYWGASSSMQTTTVEKLIQNPYFLNLEEFNMAHIPETFDTEAFYDYIKKNKKTEISLGFYPDISEEYEIRLTEIEYEIDLIENPDFKKPMFRFWDF